MRLAINDRTPSGRARNYLDPKTGKVYSQRAVQEARNGYVKIETARELRREGRGDLMRVVARSEGRSLNKLVNLYARSHGMSPESTMQSQRFWDRVGDVVEYGERRTDIFGQDATSESERELREVWTHSGEFGEAEELMPDLPWEDVYEFFGEFDSDWLDDLLDDFGLDDYDEFNY
jgi:hypothetical protein